MASFWDTLGPGLLKVGGELFLQNRANKENDSLLRRAQGPLYDQMNAQAGKSLALADSMDPKAMAAERFNAQQGLLAPGQEADRLKLMRELQAKGLLGVASHQPVPGTVATPGVAMNPHMAALFAAQEGARARSAYDSLREGEGYLTDLLRRSGMLQGQAQNARATGLATTPRRPSTAGILGRGAMDALKDKQTRDAIFGYAKQVPGMISGALDWLRPSAPASYDYSFDGWEF